MHAEQQQTHLKLNPLPFLVFQPREHEKYSADPSTSLLRGDSFGNELKRIRCLFKEIQPKNTLKTRTTGEGAGNRFYKGHARSKSPNRDSLTILNRDHAAFAPFQPISPRAEFNAKPVSTDLTGVENLRDYEEDDILREMKEQYRRMIEEEDNDLAEEPVGHRLHHLQCNRNDLALKQMCR